MRTWHMLCSWQFEVKMYLLFDIRMHSYSKARWEFLTNGNGRHARGDDQITFETLSSFAAMLGGQ